MRVKWSQNFLADRNVARRIVSALDLDGADNVLEIGPGRGILTDLLLLDAGRVHAVEIDPELHEALVEKYHGLPSLTLTLSDFLEFDLLSLAETRPPLKIIGNLPYAVVSPIIQKVLAFKNWSRAVFMVQKEVGDRMLAKPGTKNYGVLSIAVQSQCEIKKLYIVGGRCFRPEPKVDSMVLKLAPLANPVFSPEGEENFFRVVKAGFAHRRKTLPNSLHRALDLPSDRILAALEKAKISPQVRAETLSIDDFRRLSQVL